MIYAIKFHLYISKEQKVVLAITSRETNLIRDGLLQVIRGLFRSKWYLLRSPLH